MKYNNQKITKSSVFEEEKISNIMVTQAWIGR